MALAYLLITNHISTVSWIWACFSAFLPSLIMPHTFKLDPSELVHAWSCCIMYFVICRWVLLMLFFWNMIRCEVRLEYASDFILTRKWPFRLILFWELLDYDQGHFPLYLGFIFCDGNKTLYRRMCHSSDRLKPSLWRIHNQRQTRQMFVWFN